MQVDIGFGDVVFPKITKIKYPIILDFDAPVLRMYTLESTIAEKFEAMVKLDILNSRMKDLYDIWILSKEQEFDGAKLLEALKATFERRQTIMPANPTVFTETFYSDKKKQDQWRAFLRKNNLRDISDLQRIIKDISRFLVPVATAITNKRSLAGSWKSDKGWE